MIGSKLSKQTVEANCNCIERNACTGRSMRDIAARDGARTSF
ncbi:hypothetical protein BRPE64_ACDS05690 [Caballeronia insecticola]|uniref:Uncharacterized protein n=1 Tax=Caballeronia insecticola TaxID=758793 RepID=R4WFE1_9BURK|nr:hypothetical protein BRPE64_ACDS05690 [Caballeronia insecticola]